MGISGFDITAWLLQYATIRIELNDAVVNKVSGHISYCYAISSDISMQLKVKTIAKQSVLHPYKCKGSNVLRGISRSQGFTIIELVVVIVILGTLAATAISRYANLGGDARIAALKGLAGAVNAALFEVKAITAIRGQGTAGAQVNITWINMDSATPVRLWNGYPDRWCDGIGATLIGASVAGGCYLSTAPVPYGNFTFYGFGNTRIPNADAGWRIESAPDPLNCSVSYHYGGTATPIVNTNISGC